MSAQSQKAPEAEKPPAATEVRNIVAAVARGRSIQRQEGKGEPTVRYTPGMLVTLPADEADRLMRLGFLNNPNGEQVVAGIGPVFEPKGPSVIRLS